MALLGRFFGRTASEGAAYAFGVATGPVLAPATETIRQAAWDQYQSRIPAVGVLAEGVAQGQVALKTAQDWAHKQGFSDTAFAALVDVANVGPGSGYAFELWRRGLIDEPGFRRALLRLGIEQEWIDDLTKLHDVLLSPAELANARQQGYIDKDRQHSEAALQGITDERAEIQYEMVGLPPGHAEAQHLLNRGLISATEFAEIIREGRTKTKYTHVLQKAARYVLSPTTYIDARIRGWIDQAAMVAGVGLHGLTPEDADLLFKVHGRPLAWRQVFIGLRRGGVYDGPTGHIPDAILKAFEQSSLRPEWYNLAYAAIENYPSVLALRTLAQSGTLTEAQTDDTLLKEGWNENFAKQVAAAWAQGTTAKADTTVTSERTRLRTTTHSSYIAGEITKTAARNALGAAGVAAASITEILGLWDTEKGLIRAQLTAANIKKAFNKGGKNNATGKPWTRDEALAALIELGWAALAANDYLDIP